MLSKLKAKQEGSSADLGLPHALSTDDLNPSKATAKGGSTESGAGSRSKSTVLMSQTDSMAISSGGGYRVDLANPMMGDNLKVRRGKKKKKRGGGDPHDSYFQQSRSTPTLIDPLVISRLKKLRPSIRKAHGIGLSKSGRDLLSEQLTEMSTQDVVDARLQSVLGKADVGSGQGDQLQGSGSSTFPSSQLSQAQLTNSQQERMKESSAFGDPTPPRPVKLKARGKGVSFAETVEVAEVDMDASVAHFSGASGLRAMNNVIKRSLGEEVPDPRDVASQQKAPPTWTKVEQRDPFDIDESEITPEYLEHLEEYARQQQRKIEAAKSFIERNRALTAEQRATDLAAQAMELSKKAQEARDARVEVQRRHHELQRAKRENDGREMEAASKVYEADRKKELERIALLQLQLEDLRKKKEATSERALETEAHVNAIGDQLKKRDTNTRQGIASILEHAEVLKDELESGSYDEQQLARYRRSLVQEGEGEKASIAAFVDAMITERRVKRDQGRFERQMETRRLNMEKNAIDVELVDLARRRQVLQILAGKGLDTLVEIEAGHAPPMELVVTNWLQDPNCPPLEDTEEALSIEDLIAWLRNQMPLEEKKLVQLREEYEEMQADIPALPYEYKGDLGYHTYDRVQLPARDLVSSVLDQIIDDALENVVDVQADNVLALNVRRWETRMRQLDQHMDATARDRAVFSITTATLNELVEESIRSVYDELVALRQVSMELADQYVWSPFEAIYGTDIQRDKLQATVSEMKQEKAAAGKVFVHRDGVERTSLPQFSELHAHVNLSQREREWFEQLRFSATQLQVTATAGGVSALSIAPSGHHFVVTTERSGIYVFDLLSSGPKAAPEPAKGKGKKGAKSKEPTTQVTSLSQDATGSTSIAYSFQALRIMHHNPYKPHTGIAQVAWSPDGQQLVTLDHERRVRIWFTLADQSSADAAREDPTGEFVPPGPSMIASMEFPRVGIIDHIHNKTDAVGNVSVPDRKARSAPTAVAVVPAMSLVGTSGSVVVALDDGDVMKCSVDSLSRSHVYGRDLDHEHRYGTRVPVSMDPKDPRTIGVTRELFQGHNDPVVFIGFVENDPERMVTLDASGLVCHWTYTVDKVSTFGWFKPQTRVRLDLTETIPVKRQDDRPRFLFPAKEEETFYSTTSVHLLSQPGFEKRAQRAWKAFRRSPLQIEPVWVDRIDGGYSWKTYLPHGVSPRPGAVVRAHKILVHDTGLLLKHMTLLVSFREETASIGRVAITPSGRDLVVMLTFTDCADPRLLVVVFDLLASRVRPVRIDAPLRTGVVPGMAVGPIVAALGTDFVYLMGTHVVVVYSLATGQPMSIKIPLSQRKTAGEDPIVCVSQTHKHLVVAHQGDKHVTVYTVKDRTSTKERALLARGPKPRLATAPLHLRLRDHHWANRPSINVEKMVRNTVNAWVDLASDPTAREGLSSMWEIHDERRKQYHVAHPEAPTDLPPPLDFWEDMPLQSTGKPQELDLVTWGHSKAAGAMIKPPGAGGSSVALPTLPTGARTDKSGVSAVNRNIWKKVDQETWEEPDRSIWPKPLVEEWGLTPGRSARASDRPVYRQTASPHRGPTGSPGHAGQPGVPGSTKVLDGKGPNGDINGTGRDPSHTQLPRPDGPVWAGFEQQAALLKSVSRPATAERLGAAALQASAADPTVALAVSALLGGRAKDISKTSLEAKAAQDAPVRKEFREPRLRPMIWAALSKKARETTMKELAKNRQVTTRSSDTGSDLSDWKPPPVAEVKAPQGARAFAGRRDDVDAVKGATVEDLEPSYGGRNRAASDFDY